MSIVKTLRERSELLNAAELAALLVVTQATVLRWARMRQIPHFRIGDTIRFDPDMIADWVERRDCTPTISAFPGHAGNSSEYQMSWQDLGEIVPAPEEFRSPRKKR